MTSARTCIMVSCAAGLVAGALLAAASVMGAPHVGFDFCYFLPRLIDVYLHQRTEGLWTIQWWTPSFGAGLPAFFNPQHTQFMLAQWLLHWLGPWQAAVAQAALFNAFGCAMLVWICARRMGYGLGASLLAGATFATSGFMWEHTLAGHMSFNVFPVVAIVPEALHRGVSTLRAVAWLALGVAVMVYGAGYTVIITFGLTCLLLAGLLPWAWPECYRVSDVTRKLVFGAAAATATVAIKVSAALLFLSSFPRLVDSHYDGRGFLAVPSLLWQLFGRRMFLGLALWFPFSGDELQPLLGHGEDVGYGLVTLLILLFGATRFHRQQLDSPRRESSWPLVLAVAGAIWITTEFTLGRGLVWPILKPLPFLRSLNENHRLAASFALPLALCVAPCWSALIKGRSRLAVLAATVVAIVGTLASVVPYFRARTTTFWFSSYDVSSIATTWNRLEAAPEEHFPIERVSDLRDDATFLAHASSWKPYEPIFGYGYGGSEFQAPFPPGEIERLSQNPVTWRFHDPRRLLVPGIATRDRFAPWNGDDAAGLRQLLDRRQPAWTLPTIIYVGTVTTLAAILALTFYILASSLRAIRELSKRPSLPEIR